MTNQQLATPELVKANLLKRIAFHSRLSQIGFYHGKRVRHAIKSCFSEKKTKRFKRVHKIKKWVYSEILEKKLYVRMTKKAERCIKKAGSFDKYILVTPPKQLDSKMGEYYRELMMRRINDPYYNVPYVIGEGKKEKIKHYQRYYWNKDARKMLIPKDFRKTLQTHQRKFGTSVEELDNDDYQKYLESEKLRRSMGKEVDRSHPLLAEIEGKLRRRIDPEEMARYEEKAEQFKQEHLNSCPKYKDEMLLDYEYEERELMRENDKLVEIWVQKLALEGEVPEGEEEA